MPFDALCPSFRSGQSLLRAPFDSRNGGTAEDGPAMSERGECCSSTPPASRMERSLLGAESLQIWRRGVVAGPSFLTSGCVCVPHAPKEVENVQARTMRTEHRRAPFLVRESVRPRAVENGDGRSPGRVANPLR